jgi:DNA-binding MarR family transcriptional regulator
MRTSNPTDLSDVVTRLILQVFRLNGRLLVAGDRLVEDLGLTSARWQVLGAIALADTPQPVASIARNMGLTRQAVQRTANEMVAAGLLEFAPNPHHERAQLAMLTKKGAAAQHAAMARQAPWAHALGEGLREKDLVVAQHVLAVLLERLDNGTLASIGNAHTRRAPRNAKAQRRPHGHVR